MREPVTKELRFLIDVIEDGKPLPYDKTALVGVANTIDVEHKRRMEDCRRNTKRELVRYLRGVLTDYDHNIKRVRKGDRVEVVVRCRDCRWAREASPKGEWHRTCRLRPLMQYYVRDDDFCSHGERGEDE